jgi:hypothetical protein
MKCQGHQLRNKDLSCRPVTNITTIMDLFLVFKIILLRSWTYQTALTIVIPNTFTLKMEVVYSVKTLVSTYQATRCPRPEGHIYKLKMEAVCWHVCTRLLTQKANMSTVGGCFSRVVDEVTASRQTGKMSCI